MAEVGPRVRAVYRPWGVLLSGATVVVVLFAGVPSASASPATARLAPIAAVTCGAGGSLSFSPPLTPDGTRGSHEKIVLTESLTGCRGSPGSDVPSSPQAVRTKPIKLPATIVGGNKVVGECSTLETQLSQLPVMQSIKWGKPFPKESFDFVSRLMEQEGIFYFFEHSSGGHPLEVSLGLGAASSQAIQTCVNGSGGSLARVTFDPIISLMTIGTTVLTTGSVGGTNVATGDLLTAGVVGGPTCTSATAGAVVGLDPAAPGAATLQLESLTFGNCSVDLGPAVGTLPATVLAGDLPSAMSIGDGPGDPTTLAVVTLTIAVNGGSSSCAYASPAALSGAFDNGTNSIGFNGSSFAFTGGTGPLAPGCPASFASPAFTSVADASQNGSPPVFAN